MTHTSQLLYQNSIVYLWVSNFYINLQIIIELFFCWLILVMLLNSPYYRINCIYSKSHKEVLHWNIRNTSLHILFSCIGIGDYFYLICFFVYFWITLLYLYFLRYFCSPCIRIQGCRIFPPNSTHNTILDTKFSCIYIPIFPPS